MKVPVFHLSASGLYIDAYPNADKAAEAVSVALSKAAKTLYDMMENPPYPAYQLSSAKLAHVYFLEVEPVLRSQTDVSESDLEFYVQQKLVNVVKDYYGITGPTTLASDMCRRNY
jgi:hypothetical protein